MFVSQSVGIRNYVCLVHWHSVEAAGAVVCDVTFRYVMLRYDSFIRTGLKGCRFIVMAVPYCVVTATQGCRGFS